MNNKKQPPRKNILDSARDPSRAAEIIKMIRARGKDPLLDIDEDPVTDMDDDYNQFHEFEMMGYASNSLGLYKDIIFTYELETDPDKLKEIFEDTIFVMLKDMPDCVAQRISRNLNGIY